MKKLHLFIGIIFTLFICITNLYSQNNIDKTEKTYIYNRKGQLLADTNLIADSSIAYIYENNSRIIEQGLYSELLYLIVYREFFIESGIQGKLIFKFELQLDPSDCYYSIIKNINIVGHSPIDIDTQQMFLNMNKEFLLDKKIFTGNRINNNYIFVPIDYRIVSNEEKKNVRFVHKFFEDGYLVIETSAHYLVNYDNK